MKSYKGKSYKRHTQPTYNIIVNPKASGYSKQKIELLLQEIVKANCRYFLTEPDSPKNTTFYIKRILAKKPTTIIACGGDSTVNLVARNLMRRTTCLGILPLGRFNNIYRSLFGKPDIKVAIRHMLSGQNKRIDCGVASGNFFLGSVALGLIPELFEFLNKKRTPRFAISWSRLAAQAAASATVRPLSIKVDAFGFTISPQTTSISLLSYGVGLPLVPASIDDDGKCEVVFDIGQGKAIMSSYIRQIFKQKYIYSDEIRMFRGEKVSISPVEGRKLYIDGEITECREPELRIEIFPKRVRVSQKIEK